MVVKIIVFIIILFSNAIGYGQLIDISEEEKILSEYDWMLVKNLNLECEPNESTITESHVDKCAFIDAFEMFPNPTDNNVTIKFKGSSGMIAVVISDLTGSIIYEEKLHNFEGRYNNLIALPSDLNGIYLVSIIRHKEVFIKKLVIK